MLSPRKRERLLKLHLGILTWKLKETVQREERLSEQGINAILSRTGQHLRIGLVRCGQVNQ